MYNMYGFEFVFFCNNKSVLTLTGRVINCSHIVAIPEVRWRKFINYLYLYKTIIKCITACEQTVACYSGHNVIVYLGQMLLISVLLIWHRIISGNGGSRLCPCHLKFVVWWHSLTLQICTGNKCGYILPVIPAILAASVPESEQNCGLRVAEKR